MATHSYSQLRPKLEIRLRRETFRVVVFTEYLAAAKLLLEEMELSELNEEKLERRIDNFLAEIFH